MCKNKKSYQQLIEKKVMHRRNICLIRKLKLKKSFFYFYMNYEKINFCTFINFAKQHN